MHKITFCLAGLLLVLFSTSSPNAEVVGFRYKGAPHDTLGATQATVTGDFFYETSVPDASASPNFGLYDQSSIPSAKFRYRAEYRFEDPENPHSIIDEKTLQIGEISVEDNGFEGDSFVLFAGDPAADFLFFILRNSTGTAFSNDALPTTWPPLGAGTGVRLDTTFTADITSVEPISVSAVPLPSALPLFLAALSALGLLGWRKRRRQFPVSLSAVAGPII